MVVMAARTSSGKSNTSFPARMASASVCPFSKCLVTPFISKASVKISPSKLICSLAIPVTIDFDSVEGLLGLSSRAGTFKCPTMKLAIPCLANV